MVYSGNNTSLLEQYGFHCTYSRNIFLKYIQWEQLVPVFNYENENSGIIINTINSQHKEKNYFTPMIQNGITHSSICFYLLLYLTKSHQVIKHFIESFASYLTCRKCIFLQKEYFSNGSVKICEILSYFLEHINERFVKVQADSNYFSKLPNTLKRYLFVINVDFYYVYISTIFKGLITIY